MDMKTILGLEVALALMAVAWAGWEFVQLKEAQGQVVETKQLVETVSHARDLAKAKHAQPTAVGTPAIQKAVHRTE